MAEAVKIRIQGDIKLQPPASIPGAYLNASAPAPEKNKVTWSAFEARIRAILGSGEAKVAFSNYNDSALSMEIILRGNIDEDGAVRATYEALRDYAQNNGAGISYIPWDEKGRGDDGFGPSPSFAPQGGGGPKGPRGATAAAGLPR